MSIIDSQWMSYLLQSPYYLALLIAGIMCISNHRRNPRGATLLGLAILLNLIATGIWLLFSLLFSGSSVAGLDIEPRTVIFGMTFVSALLHAGSWILAALAVFARSRHDGIDYFHAENDIDCDQHPTRL